MLGLALSAVGVHVNSYALRWLYSFRCFRLHHCSARYLEKRPLQHTSIGAHAHEVTPTVVVIGISDQSMFCQGYVAHTS